MNYGSDCGCPAPAPKPVKTIGVQPLAPTEEIVCPDSRCMPHLLNSLSVTDDSVPNYVGVYKGQSYIAPMRAAVDSVIVESMNDVYRQGKLPVVTNYRDLEAIPVIQKENCQKMAVAAFPTIAKAMTEALPAAPAGYEPSKVMTTDSEGDVYLASALQVVSPELIPAIIDNCEKGKFKNIPAISNILGFGLGCKEFGETTIKQFQEALSKVVPLASVKTLPDALRGFKGSDEFRYPVALNAVLSVESKGSFGGRRTGYVQGADLSFGQVPGPTLTAGAWIVVISYRGAIGAAVPQTGYVHYGMETPLGNSAPTVTHIPGNLAGDPQLAHSLNQSKVLHVAEGSSLALYARMFVLAGVSTSVSYEGEVTFTAHQIPQTNLVVNGAV